MHFCINKTEVIGLEERVRSPTSKTNSPARLAATIGALNPVLFLLLPFLLTAGDGFTGPFKNVVDFSGRFKRYTLSETDLAWGRKLARRFRYEGKIVHFGKTDLLLTRNEKNEKGQVYQCIELPQYFYVVPGDVMFDLNKKYIYSPGVGGFSMHAPKQRDFIICFNFQKGGVPAFHHTDVGWKRVEWKSDLSDRFESRRER